jgi:hypothetical protein
MWVDVSNGGGGADMWDYLERNHPEAGWIHTDCLDGFMEEPVIAGAEDCKNLAGLQAFHRDLVSKRTSA